MTFAFAARFRRFTFARERSGTLTFFDTSARMLQDKCICDFIEVTLVVDGCLNHDPFLLVKTAQIQEHISSMAVK